MFWIRLRSSIILVIAALFLLLTGDWVLAAGWASWGWCSSE